MRKLKKILVGAISRMAWALNRAIGSHWLIRALSLFMAVLLPLPALVAGIMSLFAKVEAPPIVTTAVEVAVLFSVLAIAQVFPLLVVCLAYVGFADICLDLQDAYSYYRAL